MDLAAYRLVQEGLTNSLRHAGAGAKAVVTVRHEPHELDVRVEDDGRGTAPGPQPTPQSTPQPAGHGWADGWGAAREPALPPGHGLLGIRERVALYGGILNIGPLPGAVSKCGRGSR
ncbi:sensor histidine kinase [Nonomuraea antimicrobica]